MEMRPARKLPLPPSTSGAGTVDLDTGLAYATNPGNLRLGLADLAEPQAGAAGPALQEKPAETAALEIVR